ncbi:MAG: peptide ABC transporter substrate-binding protein [Anaerolineales bacterium]|nr:peptide ABC transporter substrate-binding protein [Anaerolineales bacterium]
MFDFLKRNGYVSRWRIVACFLILILVMSACGGQTTAPSQAPTDVPTAVPVATEATGKTTEESTDIPAATEAAEMPTEIPVSENPKELTVGSFLEPRVLVPYWDFAFILHMLTRMHNVGFWNINNNEELIPALCEEIPTIANGGLVPDGKTITVKLKQNILWTDGEPFTAQDVVFTWQQIMNPNNAPATTSPYDKIESIETPDDYTVIIKLSEPFAGWIKFFVQGFLPEHLLKDKESLENDPYLLNPIGTGPYELVEYVQGSHMTFDRFDGYYGDQPKIDRIYVKFIPSVDAVVAALQAGDIDVAVLLSESQIPLLEKLEPEINIITKPLGRYEVYFFNMDLSTDALPWLVDDANLRRAVAMGIDRWSIVENLLGGRTTVPNGPWMNTPWENKDLDPIPFDPEQAKQILDEAGWIPGPDGIRVKEIDGEEVRMSITNSTATGNSLREDTQLLVQQNLKDIGIEFVIKNYPKEVMWAPYNEGGIRYSGQWHMYGQFMDYFPDPDPMDTFSCDAIASAEKPVGLNYNRVCDPDLEALIEKSRLAIDPVERKKIFDEIQVYLSEKVYFIPMFNRLGVWAAKDSVTGLNPGWYTDIFWNVQEWDIAQ